jgi:hypothetical protein
MRLQITAFVVLLMRWTSVNALSVKIVTYLGMQPFRYYCGPLTHQRSRLGALPEATGWHDRSSIRHCYSTVAPSGGPVIQSNDCC